MGSVRSDLAWGKLFERVAAEKYIEKAYPGCSLVECPAYADLDWLVIDKNGKLKAFLEIKSRRVASTKYESTIVAARKHDAARFGRTYFKVKTICLVLFTDNVGVFTLTEAPDGQETIGRFDRGGPGTGVLHALYLHTRITWMPELLEPILAAVDAEQGIDD